MRQERPPALQISLNDASQDVSLARIALFERTAHRVVNPGNGRTATFHDLPATATEVEVLVNGVVLARATVTPPASGTASFTIPVSRKRPTSGAFFAEYLKVAYGVLEQEQVWKFIGGNVGSGFGDKDNNTCATRVSYALNYGGDPVKEQKGVVAVGTALPFRIGPPPAQIRACAANALGSYLGYERRSGRLARDVGREVWVASVTIAAASSPRSSDLAGCAAIMRAASVVLPGFETTASRGNW